MNELLFVYGTLRSGAGHPMHVRLAAQARYLGLATLPGKMFWVAPFPAVIDAQGEEVLGELYEVTENGLLEELDAYEGCAEGIFRRERRLAQTPAGQWRECWVYLFNQSTDGLTSIQGGDFLAFSKS